MFVHGTRLKCGKDVSGEEFLTQVFNHDLARPSGVRLANYGIEILTLPNIAHHRDDVIGVVLFEPWDDDRGIETSGIRENDFFRHVRSSLGNGPSRHPKVVEELLSEHASDFLPDRKQ